MIKCGEVPPHKNLTITLQSDRGDSRIGTITWIEGCIERSVGVDSRNIGARNRPERKGAAAPDYHLSVRLDNKADIARPQRARQENLFYASIRIAFRYGTLICD